MAERSPFPNDLETLVGPKSGWETTWQELLNSGILTLPDASSTQCNKVGLDGTGYVVEINENKTYRTYMYHDPELAKCDESGQMVTIGKIIADEFNLKEFDVSK